MKNPRYQHRAKAVGTAVMAASFIVVLVVVAVVVVALRNHASTVTNSNVSGATTTVPPTPHYSAAGCATAVADAQAYMTSHSFTYFEGQLSTNATPPFLALHAAVYANCAPAALDAFIAGPYARWMHPTATPGHPVTTSTPGSYYGPGGSVTPSGTKLPPTPTYDVGTNPLVVPTYPGR